MVLIRRLEERGAELYQAGKIGGFMHLYIGQEAVSTVIAVCGDHPVLRLARRDQAGADGFLPDGQVHETPDLPRLVQLSPTLLQPAD